MADLVFYKSSDHQIWNLGRAFEHNFGPKGQEFEQSNRQRFKCRGGGVALGGRGHRDMGTLKAPNQPITIKSNSPPDLKL